MKRLIDADNLTRIINELIKIEDDKAIINKDECFTVSTSLLHRERQACFRQVKMAIKLNTVELEQAVGETPLAHWIDRNSAGCYPAYERYTCSNCGKNSLETVYCPHCGANMIGVDEEEER